MSPKTNSAFTPCERAFFLAILSAPSEISTRVKLILRQNSASEMPIQPLPVQKSATSSPFFVISIAFSTKISVSGRGIRHSGETKNSLPINSHLPIIYCTGTCALLFSSAISSALDEKSLSLFKIVSARDMPKRWFKSRYASSLGFSAP